MAKIIGNPTVTPMAVPDWNQTDETKADYIKNKPEILTEEEIKDLIEEAGGSSGDVTTPKEYIEFANGVKLVSREDGIYGVHPDYPDEMGEVLYDMNAEGFKALESDYAWMAECDGYGNDIAETYAKKTEIPKVDAELDAESDNAITNKAVVEGINAPKQVVEFNNGMKLRADGYSLIIDYINPNDVEEETVLFNVMNGGAIIADEAYYAGMADFAWSADTDSNGNSIIDTYATKEEVEERYIGLESIVEDNERTCLEGLDNHEDRITALEPVIIDEGDVDILDQEIDSNCRYYYGIVSESVQVYLSNGFTAAGCTASLYFTTPSVIPENYSQFPADAHFCGDSTDDGAFVPESNTRYTIVFDFDGYMINAYVRGVSMV